MGKVVIIYKSKYGSTQKYATWLSEALNADIMDASKAKIETLLEYDTVIFGGGLYASGINGVSFITQNFEKLKNKRLVVFTVGLGATDDLAVFEPIKLRNFTSPMLVKIKFFHLRGGMDYSKLGFVHKSMMAMMKKMIDKKADKTDEDRHFLETYGVSVDFSKKESIQPVVDFINQM